MCRILMCLASSVLVLSLAGAVYADITWTGAGSDQFWSTPENWDSGTVPLAGDRARNDSIPGPIIANEGAVGDIVYAGFAKTGEVTIDGGTLTAQLFECARRDGSEGTLHMKNGTLTCSRLHIGRSGIGHVNLNGGILSTRSFEAMGSDATGVGTMDVTAGTLVVEDSNAVATVQGYIDSGKITAYRDPRTGRSRGTLILDYNDVGNETTLTAVHKLNPNPVDGGIASPGEVELSWTLPDPCVAGEPVLVGVYFTDDWEALYSFTNPAAIQVISMKNVTSVAVQTQPKTQYYWAVDTYIGDPNDPILGPIFSFLADNAPPSVDAGPNIGTYLQDGTRTGPLKGVVTDDGESYTATWSIVEQPSDADPDLVSAVIADPAAVQTTITVSAVGTYVLKLEAFDGEYKGEDEMTLIVRPDDWENE